MAKQQTQPIRKKRRERAKLKGDGAIAQGDKNTVAGKKAVVISGDNSGAINTGTQIHLELSEGNNSIISFLQPFFKNHRFDVQSYLESPVPQDAIETFSRATTTPVSLRDLHTRNEYDAHVRTWNVLNELQNAAEGLWRRADGETLLAFTSALEAAKAVVGSTKILLAREQRNELDSVLQDFDMYWRGKRELVDIRSKDQADEIVRRENIAQQIRANGAVRDRYTVALQRFCDTVSEKLRQLGQNTDAPERPPITPSPLSTSFVSPLGQKLYDLLKAKWFDLNDLQDYAFQLDIRWSDLAGDVLPAKARSLVQHCEQHNQLERLRDLMREARPHLRDQLA